VREKGGISNRLDESTAQPLSEDLLRSRPRSEHDSGVEAASSNMRRQDSRASIPRGVHDTSRMEQKSRSFVADAGTAADISHSWKQDDGHLSRSRPAANRPEKQPGESLHSWKDDSVGRNPAEDFWTSPSRGAPDTRADVDSGHSVRQYEEKLSKAIPKGDWPVREAGESSQDEDAARSSLERLWRPSSGDEPDNGEFDFSTHSQGQEMVELARSLRQGDSTARSPSRDVSRFSVRGELDSGEGAGAIHSWRQDDRPARNPSHDLFRSHVRHKEGEGSSELSSIVGEKPSVAGRTV